jgi:hypothetical protein
VNDWKAAPDYLVYLDNAGELQYYQNGKNRGLGVIRPEFYLACEGFLVYQVRDQVSIYHKETKHRLGFLNGRELAIGDSIVGFHDQTGALYCFYRGRFERLELFEADSLKAGDNVLCYLDQNRRLRAFWNGRTGTLDEQAPQKVVCGADLIAWIDPFGRLKIFYRGRTTEPEQGYLPQQLYAGRGLLAWTDDRGESFVWSEGKTTRIMDEPPLQFGVTDYLCWFTDRNGFFKVFYENKIHTLETFAPKQIFAYGRVLAYTELDGRVRAFYKGEAMAVSDNIAQTIELTGDLISWSERPFHRAFFRRD